MDLSKTIKVKVDSEVKKILYWECSSNGVYFAKFDKKKCRYCSPVFSKEDTNV